MRVGWIFKTESIIMPVIMDLLCGPGTALAAWMRSWLPQLNRFGQSIPQVFFAGRIRRTGRKKLVVAICSLLMGMVFLGLAFLWWCFDGEASRLMQVSFLVLYALFFICVGVNNLGFNTLQGKLVQYDFRGRLFLVANLVGGGAAIVAAWFLLGHWFDEQGGNFVALFTFAGICFLAGALLALAGREDRDRAPASAGASGSVLTLPLTLIRENRQFRILAMIAACFGTSMVLFPHYQALYREAATDAESAFSFRVLIFWVIMQNGGTVLFSLFAGPAADRFGNRAVLRGLLLMIFCAPLLAMAFSSNPALARAQYFWVFLFVGVTPVTIRVLNNFALELAPADLHPQFLSVLSLCMALPVILVSQFVGWAIPRIGFLPVFWAIAVVILIGWLFTFSVKEPRSRLTSGDCQGDNLK